jgi:hypothetical protein
MIICELMFIFNQHIKYHPEFDLQTEEFAELER